MFSYILNHIFNDFNLVLLLEKYYSNTKTAIATTQNITVSNENETFFKSNIIKGSKLLKFNFFAKGVCYTLFSYKNDKPTITLYYKSFCHTKSRVFEDIKSFGVYDGKLKIIKFENKDNYLYCYDEQLDLVDQQKFGNTKHYLFPTGEVKVTRNKAIKVTTDLISYQINPKHFYTDIQLFGDTLCLTEGNLHHYYQLNKHWTSNQQALTSIDNQMVFKDGRYIKMYNTDGELVTSVQLYRYILDDTTEIIKRNGNLFCVTKLEIFQIVGNQTSSYHKSQHPIISLVFSNN